MPSSGDILQNFYTAVVNRDFATARRYLKDDLVFVGLFETYRSADQYLTALKGLMGVTERLDVKKIVAEANDAAIFFELQTTSASGGHRAGGGMAPIQRRPDRTR